ARRRTRLERRGVLGARRGREAARGPRAGGPGHGHAALLEGRARRSRRGLRSPPRRRAAQRPSGPAAGRRAPRRPDPDPPLIAPLDWYAPPVLREVAGGASR